MGAAAVAGGAGLLGAAGAIYQGQAEQQAAKYNALIANRNAVLAKQQADLDERNFRVQAKKQVGDMEASFAVSGVKLEGSAMDVMAESIRNQEQDALGIRFNGEVQASQFRAQAAFEKYKGKTAKTASYLSAAGSLLGGAANASRASQYTNTGAGQSTGGNKVALNYSGSSSREYA